MCVISSIITVNLHAESVNCEAKMKACSKMTEEKAKGTCYMEVPKKCIFPLYEFCEKELEKGGLCHAEFTATPSKDNPTKNVSALNNCLSGPKAQKSCREAAMKLKETTDAVKECPPCKIDYSSKHWEETSKCMEKAQECAESKVK